MKVCRKCKIQKNDDEFNFRNKKKLIRANVCKNCSREQIRAHYLDNRSYYLNKARSRNNKLRTQTRKFIWDYLSTKKCIDCGESNPIVLEFDHQRDKKINVSHAAKFGYDISKLKEEVSKCEIRCANCHRIKTARELGWYKNSKR